MTLWYSRSFAGVGLLYQEGLNCDLETNGPRHSPSLGSEPWRAGGTIWWMRAEEAAAEAKNVEGASCTALRIPSLPNFTGKFA